MKQVIGLPDPPPYTVPEVEIIFHEPDEERSELIETVYKDEHLDVPRVRYTEVPYPKPPIYAATIENEVIIEREALTLRGAIEQLKPRLEELGFSVIFRQVEEETLRVKRAWYTSARVRPRELLSALVTRPGATRLDLAALLYPAECQTQEGAQRAAHRLIYHLRKLTRSKAIVEKFTANGEQCYFTHNQWFDRVHGNAPLAPVGSTTASRALIVDALAAHLWDALLDHGLPGGAWVSLPQDRRDAYSAGIEAVLRHDALITRALNIT